MMARPAPKNKKGEKYMKRLIAFILVLVMALSLAACGGNGDTTTAGTTIGEADETTAPQG